MSETTSTNAQIQRAVNDLKDDFERQGENLYRNQIERLFEKRKLSPSECIQVLNQLSSFGIAVDKLQENASASKLEPPSGKDGESEYQLESYKGEGRPKASQSEYNWEFQQLIEHYDLKKKNKFLTQPQEVGCIRQVQLFKRLLEEMGEEEFEKSPEFKTIAKDGQSAQERLIVSNIRFIIQVAKQFLGISSLSLRDMVQEGVAGMIRAIEKFDETKYENRFQTYAVWWVKQSIMKAIAEQGPMIRFPHNVVGEMGLYRRAYRLLLANDPETYPSISKIADELGWEKEKTAFVRDLCSFEFSTVKPSSDGSGEVDLVDSLKDHSEGPDEAAASRNVKDLIRQALGDLDDRERTIIEWSFGLAEGEYESTLQEIGIKFNLTRERVRQIKISVLKKLKKSLGPYFGDSAMKEAIAAFSAVENPAEKLRDVRLRKHLGPGTARWKAYKEWNGEAVDERGTNDD